MKRLHVLSGMALSFVAFLVAIPASAAIDTALSGGGELKAAAPFISESDGSFDVAKRGRGRSGDDVAGRDDNGGRRGDTRADDWNGDNGNLSGSGRQKPRIPGGSGCDDPGDVLEHAECRR